MGNGGVAWESRPIESDRDRPRPIETDRDRKPETLHIPTPHLKPTASVAISAQSCFASRQFPCSLLAASPGCISHGREERVERHGQGQRQVHDQGQDRGDARLVDGVGGIPSSAKRRRRGLPSEPRGARQRRQVPAHFASRRRRGQRLFVVSMFLRFVLHQKKKTTRTQ